MNERANTTTAMVNTLEVCARFHPNCFSSGATNTLHAYSDPSARFIESPPTTLHHRLRPSAGGSFVAMVNPSLMTGRVDGVLTGSPHSLAKVCPGPNCPPRGKTRQRSRLIGDSARRLLSKLRPCSERKDRAKFGTKITRRASRNASEKVRRQQGVGHPASIQRLLEDEADPAIQLVHQSARSHIALVGFDRCALDVSCLGHVNPIVQVQLPPGVPPLGVRAKDAPQREAHVDETSLGTYRPLRSHHRTRDCTKRVGEPESDRRGTIDREPGCRTAYARARCVAGEQSGDVVVGGGKIPAEVEPQVIAVPVLGDECGVPRRELNFTGKAVAAAACPRTRWECCSEGGRHTHTRLQRRPHTRL